jgi:enoyl-CoA hydratase
MSLVDLRRGKDGVTELVLNRPEKLNAMNLELLDDFSSAVRDIAEDTSTRCVIVRGEGRAFSVGYDVQRHTKDSEEERPHDPFGDWARLRRNLERWLEVWDLEKPVIAAVHGYCAGGASMLCVCTDITLVATDAIIAWPSLPLGGGLLSPVSLWLIGSKRARELSYVVGSQMTGVEAAELGWANHAIPPDNLLEAARVLAREIVRTPASVLRLKKLALNRVMELQGFRTAFLFGAEWDAIAHTVPEHDAMTRRISEVGLAQAITWFREGGTLTSDENESSARDYL